MSAGGDLAFPGVSGHRTLKIRLLGAYLAHLHAAAAHDAHLSTAFMRVAGLVAPPQSLLRPAIAIRVLRGSRVRRRLPVVAPTSGPPPSQPDEARPASLDPR